MVERFGVGELVDCCASVVSIARNNNKRNNIRATTLHTLVKNRVNFSNSTVVLLFRTAKRSQRKNLHRDG